MRIKIENNSRVVGKPTKDWRDDITISLYQPHSWTDDGIVKQPIQINWPSYGSQPVEFTEQFCKVLQAAVKHAKKLNKQNDRSGRRGARQ